MQLFNAALLQSVTQQTRLIDTVSLPLAVLVFAYMLRNVRLLIIPLVNVLLVIAVAFAAMDGLANNVLQAPLRARRRRRAILSPAALRSAQVASTTPPFMLSVVIAMSIDYSLFLLTRFHEELIKARVKRASDIPGGGEERGRGEEGGGVDGAAWQPDADAMGAIVSATINGAGRTVLVSGTIMFACVVGLTPLPTELLASMGAGARPGYARDAPEIIASIRPRGRRRGARCGPVCAGQPHPHTPLPAHVPSLLLKLRQRRPRLSLRPVHVCLARVAPPPPPPRRRPRETAAARRHRRGGHV